MGKITLPGMRRGIRCFQVLNDQLVRGVEVLGLTVCKELYAGRLFIERLYTELDQGLNNQHRENCWYPRN